MTVAGGEELAQGTGGAGGRRRSIRGQSVAELALLLPLLLMLVLGALDLGRGFYYSSAVANACRVGAQYAFDPKTSLADVRQAIYNEAIPYLLLDPARIKFYIDSANNGTWVLTTDNTSWAPGIPLKVEVTYDFHFLIPLAKAFWGDPITMQYISVVRFE